MDNKIDLQSQEFIKKIEKLFEDKDKIHDILTACLKEVEYLYLHTPYEVFREKLITSMYGGAIKYGKLENRPWKIRNERMKEPVDFVGWTLLLMEAEGQL